MGMELSVGLGEAPDAAMAVPCSGLDVLMPHQELCASQPCPRVQHGGTKRVAEGVRITCESYSDANFPDDTLQVADGQTK